jgi:hypothetical protein
VVFNFTGAEQDWAVPARVSSINIEAFGGRGGAGSSGSGANGGSVTATISVVRGQKLAIFVVVLEAPEVKDRAGQGVSTVAEREDPAAAVAVAVAAAHRTCAVEEPRLRTECW